MSLDPSEPAQKKGNVSSAAKDEGEEGEEKGPGGREERHVPSSAATTVGLGGEGGGSRWTMEKGEKTASGKKMKFLTF